MPTIHPINSFVCLCYVAVDRFNRAFFQGLCASTPRSQRPKSISITFCGQYEAKTVPIDLDGYNATTLYDFIRRDLTGIVAFLTRARKRIGERSTLYMELSFRNFYFLHTRSCYESAEQLHERWVS
jgi:hypothetical protein